MAIIGSIRKHSSLAVIIVGVAISAFVLSDLFKGGGNQAPPLGIIDGEEISINDYNFRVDENIEIQKLNQNTEVLTIKEAFNIRVSTWNQLLEEFIMGKEYQSLALVVTPDELFDQVQGLQPHRLIKQYFVDPNTNQYSRQLVMQYLQNLDQMDATSREQWLNLEQFIKKDRLTTKYQNLISKAYYMPLAFAELDYDQKRRNAEIRYTGIPYSLVPDSLVSVTDADYQKYYDEHKHQFSQDASRDIDYVVFDVLPSEEDRENIRSSVYELYEEFQTIDDVPAFVNAVSDRRYDSTFYKAGTLPVQIDSLMFNSKIGTFAAPFADNEVWHMAKLMDIQYRPDSMMAEHILIAYQGAFRSSPEITRNKEEAEALADSLLNVINRDKSLLQSMAVTWSDDGSAKENRGDLGWFADGTMVYAFNEAVRNNKINDVVVAETGFGYHIIKVTGKQDPVKKVRVAFVDRVIEPSSKTFQDVYTEASRFAGENSTSEKFDQAVIDQGLNRRSAGNLKEMANTLPGITNAREIIRWSYYEGITLGEVSPVFDLDGSYVVATLMSIKEKGDSPLEQIKDNIKPFVLNESKAVYISEKLATAEGDLLKAAAVYNTKVDSSSNITFTSRNIPGFGSEPQVIGQIFTMEPGAPASTFKGNGGVFVVALDKMNVPAEATNLNLYQNQLTGSFKSRVSSNYMFTALQEKAKIEDNRLLFF